MSLKTSHSDANIVVDEGLSVWYRSETIHGDWTYVSGVSIVHLYTMIERHRYARKSFRYVGMTYEAAVSCRNVMVSAFTRTTYRSEWVGANWQRVQSGTDVTADIKIVHEGGEAYSVVINVNEDDVIMHKVGLGMAVDFTYEKTRTYGSDGHGNSAETEPGGS